MTGTTLARRLGTVPAVLIGFGLVTVLVPLVLPVAAVVDLIRRAVRHRPAMAIRSLAFLWVYLLGEVWALAGLAFTAFLPFPLRLEATYRLQERWTGWNLSALRWLFSVEFRVAGGDLVLPGPIVVLSRHASIIDSLLPASFIAKPNGIRLRYVLKKELLFDPALDIAGNRLPNVFLDRSSPVEADRRAIQALAKSMGPADGILIYPEGTRFSVKKLARAQQRAKGRPGEEIVSGLRKVLPPRPGGTLTILDATAADVVVLVHRGLEGLATVKDIWGGDLVGSRVDVAMWRIARHRIPPTRGERVDWLYEVWADVDEWVCSGPTGGNPT